jgi:hypothetical protein
MSDHGPPGLLGGMGPESGANLYYLPEGRTPVTGSSASSEYYCSSESGNHTLESVWVLDYHIFSGLVAFYTERVKV